LQVVDGFNKRRPRRRRNQTNASTKKKEKTTPSEIALKKCLSKSRVEFGFRAACPNVATDPRHEARDKDSRQKRVAIALFSARAPGGTFNLED